MTGRLLRTAGLVAVLGCSGAAVPPPASVGSPAPAYQATSTAGEPVDLAGYRGEAVVLNVWATWCEPCREEMPLLEALHREYGPRGLRVVGTSIDVRTSDHAVRRFVAEFGITFDILRDPDDRVSRVFQLAGVPNTVLIDRDGVIRHRWLGAFDPGSVESRALIEQALQIEQPRESE
jgi:peroxiredoxin